MGVLVHSSKHQNDTLKPPEEILDQASFIEHCDDLLLSPKQNKDSKRSHRKHHGFMKSNESTPRADSEMP